MLEMSFFCISYGALHLRKKTITFAQKKPYICAKKYLHLRNQMGIKVKKMEKKYLLYYKNVKVMILNNCILLQKF